ncbi:uncharacterized protein [Halyomorpha halys]|uniref:uncharacterized protein n=1 Tax=Halyomorpha halys TaxID=286706 RepID=UPI0006D50221|nr:uncharacterized protein LOC106689656 [Halyomorpha halys]
MSEKEGELEAKKGGFFVRIKKSLRIGGKKAEDKDSAIASISGSSETSQKSNLKNLSLLPKSKLKRKDKDKTSSEKNKLEEEVPQLVNASDGVSTSSGHRESTEEIRLDVEGNSMSSRISHGEIKQTKDDEDEQLRLYREMHEVRKQMILKEKQFQEEKLEFYKLQLEADNIIEQHNPKE